MCEGDRERPPLGYTAPHTLNVYEYKTTITVEYRSSKRLCYMEEEGEKKGVVPPFPPFT